MKTKGEATFEELKSQYPDVVESLEAKHGSPLPKNIQTLLLDTATSSVMKIEQTKAWIDRAALTTNNIIEETAHYSEFPIFWIHLDGIVDDFYEHENDARMFNEKSEIKKPILQSLDSMRAKLTKEDLSLIKFMRHSYCHIHLDYLWHKAKVREGKVVDVKPPYDSDAREIATRVIKEHNNDQQAVAYTYAQRIAEDLFELQKAIKEADEAL